MNKIIHASGALKTFLDARSSGCVSGDELKALQTAALKELQAEEATRAPKGARRTRREIEPRGSVVIDFVRARSER